MSTPHLNSTMTSSFDFFLVGVQSDMSARSMGLGNAMSVNASLILQEHERWTIRVIATVTSTFSITAALCAVYWFWMMRRNFRRDLVLLMILGDLWKSFWFWLYSIVSFNPDAVIGTGSRFCTATGFMLSAGIESCDFAVLFMSLHMVLQIFPPRHSWLGNDGLYRLRHVVVAAWVIMPLTMASLAFVNTGAAYQGTGAFCSLPIRPYWYRLALSWIPRYLIWIFIMAVAIKIYRHVGKEFRIFGEERDDSSSVEMPGQSAVRSAVAADLRRKSQAAATFPTAGKAGSSDEDVAPDDVSTSKSKGPSVSRYSPPESTHSIAYHSSRRASAPNWSAAFAFPEEPLTVPSDAKSQPTSRRGSHQIALGVLAEDFAPPSTNYDIDTRHRGSVTTIGSIRSSAAASTSEANQPTLEPIVEARLSIAENAATPAQSHNVSEIIYSRRRAIQRQLRLLFIYPVVYLLVWVIPFVYQTMNYSDHFAQHPIFALSALNTFCQCFLGFADVSVFCWREKPWRHIPGSDGTFFGSLCFWRFCRSPEWVRRQSKAASDLIDSPEELNEKSQSQAGLLASLKQWSMGRKDSTPRSSQRAESEQGTRTRPPVAHRRTYSGGSDRKHLEVERAHERLAMEREDWERNRQSLHERRASVVVDMQQTPGPGIGAGQPKEWWDKHLSDDLFRDEKTEDE